MTRSCGRALTGKASQGSRAPLDLPERLPQTRICFTISRLSPTQNSDINGGYPQPPFSEKNQLRALVNKSPGHNRSVSIQTPLMTF